MKDYGHPSRHIASAVVVGLLILLAVGSTDSGGGDSSSKSKNQNQEEPKSQEELRKERIETSFSAWDGSHRGLTKVIKASMNDPDSYDHVETVYWDKDDYLIVRTTFRGKNAFGGVVKNWVEAKVDLDGNVLAVIEQGP